MDVKLWRNKVAVIAGASCGIGKVIAERLVKEGLQVVGLAIETNNIEELAEDLRGRIGKLHVVKTDITKEEDIVRAFEWVNQNLGPLHVLINNAGVLQDMVFTQAEQKFKKSVSTNLIGMGQITREAVKMMEANGIDGYIIHINGIAGHVVTNFPALHFYPDAQTAITTLTANLRKEIKSRGKTIKVTSIKPGTVDAESRIMANRLNLETQMTDFLKDTMWIKPEEVANSVVCVLSTDAKMEEVTVDSEGPSF